MEDASGLIYGVQQQNHDYELEAMVKIGLMSKSEAVTIVNHKKDLKERVIDCTGYDEMIWIMQGSDWSHYRAKDGPISKWLNKMEDLTNKVEDMFELHLIWQRGRNRHMLTDELLCPIINTITSEVKVAVIDFYKYKRQTESDSDYEGDGERVECCWVDGCTTLRVWTPPRVREQGKNIDNIVRLLMWNPENLAQRLDLDKALSKGEQARTISTRGIGT